MKRTAQITLWTALATLMGLTGCTQTPSVPSQQNAAGAAFQVAQPRLARVIQYSYAPTTRTVTAIAHCNDGMVPPRRANFHRIPPQSGENVLDLSSPESLINFAVYHYPRVDVRKVRVVCRSGTGRDTISTTVPAQIAQGTPPAAPPGSAAGSYTAGAGNGSAKQTNAWTTAASALRSTAVLLPPPGVRVDSSIRPQAALTATPNSKVQAILTVARSKLGTPYVWGHNEDRGQSGFDCSNFAEYVYHHALGYSFSTSSRVQGRTVGYPVPGRTISPGDLLIFNSGGHVGIYAGSNQVIQEGGGLGRVGYLSLKPGGYWARHLTAVKRMF